jgi:hypothetical protein
MKIFHTAFVLFALAAGSVPCFGEEPTPGVYGQLGTQWENPLPPESFPARTGQASVFFNGEIWVIGGYIRGELADVWHSKDGLSWLEATPKAEFGVRQEQLCLSDSKGIWLIGGRIDSTDSVDKPLRNDVWFSSDGVSWKKIKEHASFIPRCEQGGLVFQGCLWMIGGRDESGKIQDDVWSSKDGIHWHCMIRHAPFGPQINPSVFVFDGKIWLCVGDRELYTRHLDTQSYFWCSSDGFHWQKAFQPPFGVWAAKVFAFDNRIWAISNSGGGGDQKPVYWSSADGQTWTMEYLSSDFYLPGFRAAVGPEAAYLVGSNQDVWKLSLDHSWQWVNDAQRFPPEARSQAVSFHNRLWLLDGQMEAHDLYGRLLWSSLDGVHWEGVASQPQSFRPGEVDLVFQDKIWSLGLGFAHDSPQIWASPDGIHWNQANYQGLDLSHLFKILGAVFQNKIWILTMATPGKPVQVYNSTDGINWNMVSEATPFALDYNGVASVCMASEDNLWIFNASPALQEGYQSLQPQHIWRTKDGKSWSGTSATPIYAQCRIENAFWFDRKIFLVGENENHHPVSDEILSSGDGQIWNQVTSAFPFPARMEFSSAFFNGKFWILGGAIQGTPQLNSNQILVTP